MTTVQNGIRRNGEIEEATNLYFVHPISARLVPILARLGVHPNTVSILGAACGIAAGAAYYFYDRPGFVFLGLALMICWHILDGADGQLARLTNKVSPYGYVIDGACDYLTFGAIYGAIGLRLMQSGYQGGWALVLLAAVSHAVQAAAFERQRTAYLHWTSGNPSTAVETPDEVDRSAIAKAFITYYLFIQQPFLPMSPEQERYLRDQAARGKGEEIAEVYRSIYRPAVKLWSILSANNRTIIIFLAFLAGMPQGYPWFELVVLNLVLAGLVLMNALLGRRLRSTRTATVS